MKHLLWAANDAVGNFEGFMTFFFPTLAVALIAVSVTVAFRLRRIRQLEVTLTALWLVTCFYAVCMNGLDWKIYLFAMHHS